MISHLGINGPRLFANLRSMKSRRFYKNHGRPDLRLGSFNYSSGELGKIPKWHHHKMPPLTKPSE